MRNLRCGECGSRDIELRNAKGKGFPSKYYDQVILTVDIDLPTCIECNNVLSAPEDAKRLDEAIAKTLKDNSV